MKLSDYQKATKETAIYPNVGNNIYYPTLGIIDELGEVEEKILDGCTMIDPDFRKELGDVLWYVVRLSDEIKVDIEYEQSTHKWDLSRDRLTINSIFSELRLSASKIAGITKKTMRDHNGVVTEQGRKNIQNHLKEILALMDILAERSHTTIDVITDENVKKLLDRKNRKVLSGDGDNR